MTDTSKIDAMSDLPGKVAVVTGATGGMGRAIVEHFARHGIHVIATDRGTDVDSEVLRAWDAQSGQVHYRAGDVTDASAVESAVGLAVERFGRLDFGVNAAAIEFETVPLADCTVEDFDTMMSVNVRGLFVSMKYQIRAILDAGRGGSIVNIASTNSFTAQPNQPAYTASKHAVLGLTRSAALDYAAHDIRINAICPGAIDTPMLRSAIERRRRDPADVARRLSPLGRFGRPEEIARAALWLCSEASSFTTGHALAVDGGMLGT